MARIELQPLGRTLEVPVGESLQDALFEQGVEFPCGGRGKCKGCRVKVLKGDLRVTAAEGLLLDAAELAAGWRLACQARVPGDLVLELAQWETSILADDTAFAFTPREGLGLAVDIGTTTVAAQLLDLRTGNVLAVRTGLNAQARHGADIVSRLEFALREGGAPLTGLVRDQIGGMIREMLEGHANVAALREAVLVGNSAMHHLFSGLDITPLAFDPFELRDGGPKTFAGIDLGWDLIPDARVHFLPCLGGFVGSDLLAGILATNLHRSEDPVALVDLGTNGEIVIGNCDRILCCSTAAGPAFEGARISMGMRAATGAISAVSLSDGELVCQVLGHAVPRGLCGSGLVDAIAACLDLGAILPSGRMTSPGVTLAGPVVLSPADVRELQLAKGAIAAGFELLAEQWGIRLEDLRAVYLAGAFGNYISRSSARRIGLLKFPLEKIHPVGNSALLGAKMALFDLPQEGGAYESLLQRIRHVPLNEHPQFQDVYAENMGFA